MSRFRGVVSHQIGIGPTAAASSNLDDVNTERGDIHETASSRACFLSKQSPQRALHLAAQKRWSISGTSLSMFLGANEGFFV